MSPRPETPGCGHALDRRAFMRNATLAAAGVLAGLGAARELLAGELATTTAVRSTGATRSYVVPAVDGAVVDAQNEVLLVRWAGWAYAFALACTHRGAKLEWHDSEARVFCPKHKARFLADGTHDSGRQTRALDRYDVRLEGNQLVVQLDWLRRVDQNPTEWRAAAVRVG